MSRKIHARKKIRSHLRNRGDHGDFEVTPALIMYWWRHINDAIFDGQLSTPYKVLVRKFNHNDTLGTCQGWGSSKKRPIVLEMKAEFDDKEMFMAILAHEMVHQWEQQTHGRMTHGKNFFGWEDKLKQLGLPLEETY